MRMQKELSLLTQGAPHVEFPKSHHPTFIAYRNQLRMVLEANNLYTAARGLRWESDPGCFAWDEDQHAFIAGKSVTVQATYQIFPTMEGGHSIKDQIETIIAQRAKLATECFRLRREEEEKMEHEEA